MVVEVCYPVSGDARGDVVWEHTSLQREQERIMQLPSHNPEKQPSDVLRHVHPTIESAALVELTPPHTERMESPEYRKVHQFLIRHQTPR